MSSKTIPIAEESQASSPMRLPVPISGRIRIENGQLIDERGRPLRDLRISLTDHCNFRCRYCMPKEKFDTKHQFLAHTELLSFEEIKRLVGIFLRFGVQKIRLTGGEPLLRKHVCNLIADLKAMRTTSGKSPDIAMTTNGTLLKRMAADLKAAGLDRVTVSLDALNEELFQSINDVGFPAAKVIESIEAAQAIGIPVKLNTVVKRGMNEGEIIPILERFRHTGVIVRFIEYMDAGTANGWRIILRGVELGSAQQRRLFAALNVDPLYAKLCDSQQCWRARLSPKPFHLGLPHFPQAADSLEAPEASAAWVARYEERTAHLAVCRLIDSVGCGIADPVLDYHDRITRASRRDLPLG